MTKKDYTMLARVMGETLAPKDTVDRLVVELTKDNARFDADRFRGAVRQAGLVRLDQLSD